MYIFVQKLNVPLTASCLSPLSRACEKVASDLGLGGGFRQVIRVPPTVTNG